MIALTVTDVTAGKSYSAGTCLSLVSVLVCAVMHKEREAMQRLLLHHAQSQHMLWFARAEIESSQHLEPTLDLQALTC